MGCGASKSEDNVKETCTPTAVVPQKEQVSSVIVVASAKVSQQINVADEGHENETNVKSLSKPIIPSIPSASEEVTATKAIAFEIPLDDATDELLLGKDLRSNSSRGEMFALAADNGNTKNPNERSSSTNKLSLPKLGLTNQDLQAKLANTEARWKDLEKEQVKRKSTKSKQKKLASQKVVKEEEDPISLKRRLLDKEATWALNRQRELEKLHAKLVKADQHVKRVQERKKLLLDDEAKWDEEILVNLKDEPQQQPLLLTKEHRQASDADSGLGQSRSGSGRSTNSNEVDITTDKQSTPLVA